MAGSDTTPSSSTDKPTIQRDARGGKAIQQRGKGKALNALAAASGRDPAAIEKALKEKEAEAAAAAAREAEEKALREAAEAEAEAERQRLARLAEEEKNQSQIYNALSPEEQYRFECFRRCGFPSKAVEKFVAKTLVEEAHRRYNVRRGTLMGLGGSMDGGVSFQAGEGGGMESGANAVTDNSSASDADATLNKKSKKRKKKTKKKLLREESKRRRAAMDQPLPYMFGGGSSGGVGSNSGRGSANGTRGSNECSPPPLDHLVVPNAASEIVAVVSTLAKCYAQRLVAAARRVAEAEDEAAKLESSIDNPEDNATENEHLENNATNPDALSAPTTAPTTLKPLRPHHFREAHRHRVQAGVDPGFWMAGRPMGGTPSSGVVASAALGKVDWNRTNYLAALAAQDAYDEQVQRMQQEEDDDDSNEINQACANGVNGKSEDQESKMDTGV